MNRLYLSLALCCLTTLPANAAVIMVDENCTLVDAITAANKDAPVGGCGAGGGADEIHLTADVGLSEVHNEGFFGVNALPRISSDVRIIGHGHTIEREKGAPAMRIFYVNGIGSLSLYSVTVARGSGSSLSSGISAIGREPLTLINATIAGNSVFAYTGTVLNSHVEGTLSIQADVDDVPPSYVRDTFLGGSERGHRIGTTTLSHSTISGNYIRALSVAGPDGRTYITNTTIAHNGPGAASGLYINLSAHSVDVTLTNTTIASNTLRCPACSAVGISYYGGRVSVGNTISAENSLGRDCDISYGLVSSRGGNFDSDGTCGDARTLSGLDTELLDRGGTTPTLALRDGSNAIGAGVDCLGTVDQRGVPRDPDACDAGAYELRELLVELSSTGSCPGTITVSARGSTPGGDVVVARAGDYGATAIARGPCAGTLIGLADSEVFARATAEIDGTLVFEAAVTIDNCADLLQAVDLETCEISDVATVGQPPELPPCTQSSFCGLERLARSGSADIPDVLVDEYLVGDWNGDGCDSIALRNGSSVFFDTKFDSSADLRQDYGGGNNEDQYLVGDWNDDGCDDLAVRRGDLLLMDTDFDGTHDLTATFGPGGNADEYLTGDLDGSDSEAVVYRDGNTFEWDLAPWDGKADGTTAYGGDNEDQYLLGYWSDDDSSHQTLAVRRGNQILMNFDLDGTHNFVQTYGLGNLEDEYLVGDWDGDGRDNLAVRNGGIIEMDTDFDDEPDITMTFGEGTRE